MNLLKSIWSYISKKSRFESVRLLPFCFMREGRKEGATLNTCSAPRGTRIRLIVNRSNAEFTITAH
jgi:hypothetical protein